jgi:hypothetical protein
MRQLKMGNKKRTIGPSFLTLGLVFLAIGFVQKEFSLSFESGFFNLGVIFTLSGIVASALNRKTHKD